MKMNVPETFAAQEFATRVNANRPRVQVAAKRSNRLLDLISKRPWPDNVRAGVPIENDQRRFQADDLRPLARLGPGQNRQ